MNTYIEKLTNLLLEKNDMISYIQAKTWVELLWSDFEATYAKAGHAYQGEKMTEKIVTQWIENYGGQLHLFQSGREDVNNYLNQSRGLLH
ncbi:YfhJ family protein [Bacillus mojavensis]|uniref:YfhJ family protein n=1 Tax=Bacillus mojavensis TaxID=72360 RepID=UPI002DB6DBF6|nr:YfhJ family protein [Bacillus mojavensis]MEC1688721.1 YfhJ family protein [Bacillus mojavensis]